MDVTVAQFRRIKLRCLVYFWCNAVRPLCYVGRVLRSVQGLAVRIALRRHDSEQQTLCENHTSTAAPGRVHKNVSHNVSAFFDKRHSARCNYRPNGFITRVHVKEVRRSSFYGHTAYFESIRVAELVMLPCCILSAVHFHTALVYTTNKLEQHQTIMHAMYEYSYANSS